MRTILFVCTGNSCRSVMAEQMLKKMLIEHSSKVEVLSAGTGTIAGMRPTECTIRVLQKYGIDASKHRSVQLTRAMIEKSDLVLVMESFHKQRVLEIDPSAEGKVYLLREFETDVKEIMEPEILDPIGKPMEVYERSFELIKDGLDNLVKKLKNDGWI